MSAPTPKTTWRAAFSVAFPYTIPVLTGYLALGFGYGVLMAAKGYGPHWSMLASATAFCGSMQYLAVTLLSTTFHPLQALFLSIMVNARHLFYSLSLLKTYNGLGKVRPFLIFALTDETFSLVCTVDPPEWIDKGRFYFALSFLDYLYWISGSGLGGVVGSLLTFNTKGLDFVLTSLFVVLFIEQVVHKENRLPGVIGLVCTVVALCVMGADNLVVSAMVLILIVLLIGRKKLCT